MSLALQRVLLADSRSQLPWVLDGRHVCGTYKCQRRAALWLKWFGMMLTSVKIYKGIAIVWTGDFLKLKIKLKNDSWVLIWTVYVQQSSCKKKEATGKQTKNTITQTVSNVRSWAAALNSPPPNNIWILSMCGGDSQSYRKLCVWQASRLFIFFVCLSHHSAWRCWWESNILYTYLLCK